MAFEDPDIKVYLPMEKPKRALNRDWLFQVRPNILNTQQIIAYVKPTSFPTAIKAAMHQRKSEAAKEQKLVFIREDILEAMLTSGFQPTGKSIASNFAGTARRALDLKKKGSKKRTYEEGSNLG